MPTKRGFGHVSIVALLWGAAFHVGCGRFGYDLTPGAAGSRPTAAEESDSSSDAFNGSGGALAPDAPLEPPLDAASGDEQSDAADAPSVDADAAPLEAESGVAWWDPQWARRRKLTFLQSSQPETVTDLPVLVVLSAARIDYAATQGTGQDLRFVAADQTTVLPHEIERYDKSGNSFVWVRVPRVQGATDTDYVWMYYGNPAASDAQQKGALWTGYDAVYHLDTVLEDASGHQPAPIDHATAEVGGIANARTFSGTGSWLGLGSDLAFLEGAASATLSARIRAVSVTGEHSIVSLSVGSTTSTTNSRVVLEVLDGKFRAFGRAQDADSAASIVTTTAACVPGAGGWQHLAATYDLGAQQMLLYVDGVLQPADSLSPPFSASAFASTPTYDNGLGSNDPGTGLYFQGDIDEVRITPLRRSAGWIDTDFRSQNDALIAYGPEERF